MEDRLKAIEEKLDFLLKLQTLSSDQREIEVAKYTEKIREDGVGKILGELTEKHNDAVGRWQDEVWLPTVRGLFAKIVAAQGKHWPGPYAEIQPSPECYPVVIDTFNVSRVIEMYHNGLPPERHYNTDKFALERAFADVDVSKYVVWPTPPPTPPTRSDAETIYDKENQNN